MNKTTLLSILVAVVMGGILTYILFKPSVKTQNKVTIVKPETKIYTQTDLEKTVTLERQKILLQTNWQETIYSEVSGGRMGGGIYDATVRVKNKTGHTIDKVIIGVFVYRGIFGNKQCHFEELEMGNIYPHSEKSVPYTYTDCGNTVKSMVTSAYCAELNMVLGN